MCGMDWLHEADLIPHGVVVRLVDGQTPLKAWRAYLGVSPEGMAERLGLPLSAYLHLEEQCALEEPMLNLVSGVLGITSLQLDPLR
ncbi:hypothetical protein D3C81_1510780 [compost metagenome]